MSYKLNFSYKNLIITLLLLVTFFLRLRDINYGLPDGSNIYHRTPYFADEIAVVEDFKKLIVFLHTKNASYLINYGYTIFGRLLAFLPYIPLVLIDRLRSTGKDLATMDVLKITQITVAGRFISLISSFFGLIIVYKLFKLLRAKFIFSLLTLFYICFNAVDIMISLQAKSNTLMNLFVMLSLYFSLLWLEKNGKKIKYLLIAAGFSGLSMSSRINGGLSLLIPLFSLLVCVNFNLERILLKKKELILILVSFLSVFLVSCPTIFLEPGMVLRIWQRAGSGRLNSRINGTILLKNLRFLVGGDFGLVIFGFIILLSLLLFKRMTKKEKIIIAWFYLYLTVSIFTYLPAIRYLYPLLTIYPLVFYITSKQLVFYLRCKLFYIFFVGMLFLILITNFFLGLSFLDFYSREDVRLIAARFVNNNFPEGSSIGTYLYPGFYGPYIPLNYDKFNLISYRVYEELGGRINNRMPDYIVIEERGYIKKFIDYFDMEDNYQLIKIFKRNLRDFGPFTFSNSYKCPQATMVRVFKRK